ncbi:MULTISPECIES: carboxymuconolactone decarboxylase family protein [Nocardia]|uniref:Carboxymuconolactone decarboxylase family protein n=1 Tax=Nocardia africana TaxID=134964 RepID=A0ABW6NHZ0_9NOCA|nr:carboxymuconolactone decarboxylase family protein [Nocardia violaceofusca]
MVDEPTRAQQIIGALAPKLVELTDDVLFGDVWARSEMSPRDRSLLTIASLVTQSRPTQLHYHLARALDNGLTSAQLAEAITHLAFYAGWPAASAAISTLRAVLEERRIDEDGGAG